MSILDPLMRYGNAVAMEQGALQSSRATSGEAEMIDRLASNAQALAAVYGEPLSRKAAIKRVRENIAFVRQVAALKGVEW